MDHTGFDSTDVGPVYLRRCSWIRLEGKPFRFEGHEYLRAIYDDTVPSPFHPMQNRRIPAGPEEMGESEEHFPERMTFC